MFGWKKLNKLSSVPDRITEEVYEDKSLKVDLPDGSFLRFGNMQHQGRREYQEDSYGYSNLINSELIDKKGVLAVLADGMGGLANGKDVSSYTVSAMIEYFNSPETLCRNGSHLRQWAEAINKTICGRYSADGKIHAGSTIVCAMIKDGTLHWLSVGDSRIYLKRKDKLYQINEDNDYLNRLLGEAIFDETSVSSAFRDPQKDVLVSCIGNPNLSEFDFSIDGMELQSGDKILICSDGVYNALPKLMLSELLENDPHTSAQRICDSVLNQNIRTQDNFTAIVISYN